MNSKSLKISQRIFEVRTHFDLTKEALGELAEVSGTSIANIESGVTKNPGTDLLSAIASKLGVDGHWLLTGEGKMLKPVPGQDTGINNSDVSGEAKKVPISKRILTGDRSRGEQPGFGYSHEGAGPKQVLGNMVEQLDQNTSDIEDLRAALLKIQQQLKN